MPNGSRLVWMDRQTEGPTLMDNVASVFYVLSQVVLMPLNQVTDTSAIFLVLKVTSMTIVLGTLQALSPSAFSLRTIIHYVRYVIRFFISVTMALVPNASLMLVQGTI